MNRTIRHLSSVCALLVALHLWPALRSNLIATEQPIRVLILSGQNNHDWRATTPQLKEILLMDGRFAVDVTEHPEKLDDSAKEKYDLLLSNWNSWGDSGVKDWSSATRETFLSFVREGRGLVVVHAGSSSFLEWDDYQSLVGGTWGKETGHGAVHTFTVRLSNNDHPITRGLESFQITDELWHRVPLRSVTVLATAFSAADKGGSGKDESVAFTTSFGKGRCFNLVLGHDVGAMKAPGFQILLRRGAEWAARNVVSIPAKPSDDQALFQSILRDAESYQFGQSRTSLMRVESLVASAGVRGGAPILAKALASKLTSTSATFDAKKFLCQQLSLISTKAEVPTVAAVLFDTNLFYEAVIALQRIPGDEAREALLNSASSASVPQQIVIVNALAARGEPESASRLTELARSDDASVSTAALRALGRIKGGAGLNALSELESSVSDSNRLVLRRAQLSAARNRVEAGDMDSVRPLLKKLLADTEPLEIQAGALLLDAIVPESSTEKRLLNALRSDDHGLRAAAVGGLKLEKNRAALLRAARELGSLPRESQLVLLTALDEVSVRQALPQVLDLLRSAGMEIRLIALNTIASVGNESAIDLLVRLLSEASGEEKQRIVAILARLPGANVDQALANALKSAEPANKPWLVEAMVARSSAGLPEFLLDALESADPRVRAAALAGLEKVGTVDSAPALLRRLGAAPEAEASLVESALAQIYRREGKLRGLEEQLAGGNDSTKPRLLNVAAAVGGPEPLRLIQKEARSQDPDVALTALRILAEWPDDGAFDALSSIAASARDNRSRTLAIRGLVRLAPQVKQDADAAAQSFSQMLPQANVSEKKQLLSALGELPGGAGLEILRDSLDDPDAGAEARRAAVKALEAIQPGPNEQAKQVLNALKRANPEPVVKDRLQVLDWKFSDLPNLSPTATATSTTGLTPDGQGGPASAAIDGNLESYWDETDNQKLYALKIELEKRAQLGFLRICGWKQHEYAPKDFEVLCDGKPVTKVESAQYHNNWLTVPLNGIECQFIELRIHGYYAASPAIRELEVRGKFVETKTTAKGTI